MKQGPLNKQLSEAEQVLSELRARCVGIAGEIAGYKSEIDRIESSDIDLDTAATTVGALKSKIGILEKREEKSGAAYKSQEEKVAVLKKEKDSEIESEVVRTAIAAVDDLNTAFEKLLPKFKHLKASQRLAGRYSRWDEIFVQLFSVGIVAVGPVLDGDDAETHALSSRISDTV